MTKPLILVTAATGKTGSAVVAELAAQRWPVRALVRQVDTRAEALRALGAEIVVADMFDVAAMRRATAGVHRAYWCAPFDPRAFAAAETFATVATEAQLEAITGLSQWLASADHPALATRNAYQTDQLFAGLAPDILYTSVNPGFFADNYLRLIGFAAHLGVLPSLTGKSRNAPPSNEDIARVAVATLIDPEQYSGRSYRPTGPALLSGGDMARILTGVVGRKVRAAPMPLWLFLKAARMQHVSGYELSGFRHYIEDHKQGAFEFGAPTDVVQMLTGRPPEDFATVARRYAELPEARRTFSNGARAWFDFMRTPMMPGYNLSRIERNFVQPKPQHPKLAMDNPAWLTTHGAKAVVRPAPVMQNTTVLA